jgi:hypothetical protein
MKVHQVCTRDRSSQLVDGTRFRAIVDVYTREALDIVGRHLRAEHIASSARHGTVGSRQRRRGCAYTAACR